jgi:hypothetical protein
LPHEPHMMNVTASEVQALDAEAIIFGSFVLLNETARFERREQSEDVVLMQLKPLGKFRNAQFIDVAEKLFEHVERVRDGLDDVVGFVSSDHRAFRLIQRGM